MGEAEAALKKLKSSSFDGVFIKQENTESSKIISADEGNDKKRRKIEPSSAPPPPSASQVIARELERHKKTVKSKKAAGTPSNQGTPAYSPSNSPVNSPSPSPTSEEGKNLIVNPKGLLSDEDVIKLLKSSSQNFTVKEIVAHFKSNLLQNSKNKDQIREIMRRILNHDKTTGKVSLKKEYLQ